jgi:hypothetical protein
MSAFSCKWRSPLLASRREATDTWKETPWLKRQIPFLGKAPAMSMLLDEIRPSLDATLVLASVDCPSQPTAPPPKQQLVVIVARGAADPETKPAFDLRNGLLTVGTGAALLILGSALAIGLDSCIHCLLDWLWPISSSRPAIIRSLLGNGGFGRK